MLEKELRNCDAFVCIVTQNTSKSDWVKFEVGSNWIQKTPRYFCMLTSDEKFIPNYFSHKQSASDNEILIVNLLKTHTNIDFEDRKVREFINEQVKDFNEKNKMHLEQTEHKFEIDNNPALKSTEEVTEWETRNSKDTLPFFYVILPEKIPYKTLAVRESIRENIYSYGTKYRYLFHEDKENKNIKHLTKMIKTITEENKENIELYEKNIEYAILSNEQIMNNFLHKTQMWYKHSERIEIVKPGCIVLLDHKSDIQNYRYINENESHNLGEKIENLENKLDWKMLNLK
jgi:hypothetical protein